MKLITKEEAAKLLNVKPSTVGRYWRQGKLSWKVINGRRRCVLDEVFNLKEDRNTYTKMSTRDEFIRLKYRVAQLERTIEMLARKLNMREAVDMSDSDLQSMYDLAKSLSKDGHIKKVSAEGAVAWANGILSISEADLSRLKRLTKDPFPWATFVAFIDAMSEKVRNKKTFSQSLPFQQAVLELQVSRDHIRKMGELVFSCEGMNTKDNKNAFVKTLLTQETPIRLKPLP